MSSTVGVSSLHQSPFPELASSSSFFSLRRVPPPRLLSFPGCRSHVKCFTLFQQGGGDRSIASSAVVTPNSVLSEEAFKGLTGFSHDALRVQEEEEEEEEDHPSDVDAPGGHSTPDRDLAIANLGLPQPLVDSLHKRGITHLFPIQVVLPFLSLSPPSSPPSTLVRSLYYYYYCFAVFFFTCSAPSPKYLCVSLPVHVHVHVHVLVHVYSFILSLTFFLL